MRQMHMPNLFRGRVSRAGFSVVFSLSLAAISSFGADTAAPSGPIPIQALTREKAVDFSSEVLPLFKKNCLACHNASDAKGDLVMETPQTILKGGETGPAVVPGKAGESLLLKVASHIEKPFMPPKNNKSGALPFSPEELGLIQLWVNQGATGVVSTALGPVHWQPLPAGLHAVGAVALSPNGLYAACSRANQIFIYNLASGQLESRLTDPELIKSGFSQGLGIADKDIIQSLAFSPDSQTLASGAYRSVKLWKKPAPELLASLQAASGGEILALSASDDGKWIATGHEDGSAKLWDGVSGKLAGEFRSADGPMQAVALSLDGATLAGGTRKGTITVWNTREPGKKISFQSPSEVTALSWATEPKTLLSGGSDHQIRVWQIPESQTDLSAEIPQIVSSVALNAQGTEAALLSEGGNGLWIDLASGKALRKIQFAPQTSIILPGATNALAISSQTNLSSWSLADSKKLWETNLSGTITAGAFDQASGVAALHYKDGGIELFYVKETGLEPIRKIAAEARDLSGLKFSPNGQLLYAVSGQNAIQAFKVADGAEAFAISGQPKINDLALGRDGKCLATAHDDKKIRLWSAENGSALPKGAVGDFAAPAMKAAFSADGSVVLGGSSSGEIIAFNLKDGTQRQKFDDANGVIHNLAVGASNQVISLAALNSVKFGSLLSQRLISGHGERIDSLHFAPKAKQVISSSKDGSARLWNFEDGKLIRQFDHGGEITDAALSPDGKRLVSAGRNNNLKLWNAADGKLITEIKGDSESETLLSQRERDLKFARDEVNYHKSAVDTAEKQEKTESEALKKAMELKEKTEKELAAKTAARAKAQEERAAAEKAKTDLAASIAAAKDKKAALEKARIETAASAKDLEGKLKAAREALEKTRNEKESLVKNLLEASFQARLASLQAAENKQPEIEKQAADKRAAAEALIDKTAAAKNAFQTAATEAEALAKSETVAKQAAKSAEEAFAANEKIVASADQATKDAAKKFADSEKPLTEAEAAFKTAEGAHNGALQALEATSSAQKKAAEQIAQAKKDKEAAEAVVAKAESALEAAKKARGATEKPFLAAAFSSDNRLIAAGSESGALFFYSAENGKPLGKIEAHEKQARALAFLPNGTLASGGADKALKIWSAEPGWQLAKVLGDGGEKSPFVDRVLALSFSPDGKWLATGGGFPSRSGEIMIWKTADWSLFKQLKDPHSDTVYALEFSPDLTRLASGGADKYMRVFDLDTGKQVKMFEGHTHHVLGVAWERNGRTIASAGADKVVKVWDYASGEQKKTIEGFGKEVTFIRFLDASNEAVVSCGDTQVKLVRDDGGQVRSFGGSSDYVQAASATPDGQWVAAGSMDGNLRIWKGSNGELFKAFESPKEPQAAQVAGTK
jgi:WD40 repeat protein